MFNETWCSSATDDDGQLLWAAANGDCIWAGGDVSTDYFAPFAYDAVYAIAYAMNRTMAAAPNASFDGTALMAHLLNTTFVGATGLVGFDEHGDRDVGLSYEVYNVISTFAGVANLGVACSNNNQPAGFCAENFCCQKGVEPVSCAGGTLGCDGYACCASSTADAATPGMPLLGQWQQGVTWSSRFTSSRAYVAADGSSRAPEVPSSALVLRLGVLCEAATEGSSSLREECDMVQHTVDRLNDKADGWFDALLPDHTIVTATRSVGCGENVTRDGWLQLEESLPGFAAVIGPACSNDVADVTQKEWRARNESSDVVTSSRAVVISPKSTAPKLSDEIAYPNLARAVSTDEHRAKGFAKLCNAFRWDRVAVLHDDSAWGVGGAHAFKTSFQDMGGEILTTVTCRLYDFDTGFLHARELLEQLSAASPRVIVLVTQLRVQRALCTPSSVQTRG